MSRLNHLAAALLALGLSACGASNDHGHDHADGGHAHDEHGGHADEGDHGHGHGGGVVVTDFTETAELFVKFPPFAVGRESPFAAHFTRLDTFAPVSTGEAIVRLSGGGVAEEVFRADPSATAGIFRPVAVPRHAAKRRVTVELRSGDLVSIHDLGEYQVYRTASDADASLPEEVEGETLVPFLKEQQWKVDFATTPVLERTLARSVSVPGTLTVSPNAEARVAAPADGLVSAPQGGFPELGATVTKGDLLVRITPRLGGDLDRASLYAEFESAEAALEAARSETTRVEGLLTDGAVPQRRVDEARAAERQSEARYNAARSRANAAGGSGGVSVRAPIDGRVVEVNVTPGAFASSGEALFHIVDDQSLRLVARVAEADMASLGVPQGAWFRIAGSDATHDLRDLNGRLVSARANIAVKLYGPDLYELRRQAETIRASMEGVPGVVDLSIEQQADVPTLTVDFQRQAIGQYGLTTGDVAEMIEAAFAGAEVSRVLENSAAFDLVVRYDQAAKASLDAVSETRFVTPTGAEVPLKALADIRRDRGPNTISRENGARKIVIMANVAGGDLLSTVGDIRANIETGVNLPSGYYVEYGGQFESANAATGRLTLLSIAVVLGVFVLLYMAFNSARDATLVMVNLPLALIGGVAGVYLSGGILSVASIIGFITLFGIATRNGVMMVAHIRHLVDSGETPDFLTAVRQGAMEWLVPILMTALATALALVPLAMRAGEPGSEIQSPMAMVILCGLTTSTILNMIVLPALYARFGERHARSGPVDEDAAIPQPAE